MPPGRRYHEQDGTADAGLSDDDMMPNITSLQERLKYTAHGFVELRLMFSMKTYFIFRRFAKYVAAFGEW